MASSRAEDVQFALRRAKKKISSLQQQLINKSDRRTSSETSLETSLSAWTPSKELRDSLVDMYTANPRVNEELRQRLPSPETQKLSNSTQQRSSRDRSEICLNLDHTDWPQAPQHLQEPPTSCSTSPRTYRRSVSPVSPHSHRRSVSPVALMTSRPPGGAGEMEMDLSPSRGPSPWAENCWDVSDGGRGSRGSPTARSHLVASDDSSHQVVTFGPISVAPRRHNLDRDKNVSFLLKELDGLRDINKKLQDQLVQKEKSLQRREVEEELREEQREAQGLERPAAVLEEVLAAQKDRDQALMSRLLLANEERDEAVLRARQLHQASELEDFHLEDSHLDVEELLQCVCDADSVQEVERFGSVLVQRLQLARQRRNDITAQEMKAVLEERDVSVAKCKRLEQDLIQAREHWASEEELLRVQRERGGALEDRRQLEVELQPLRANHSSQNLHTPPPLMPSDGVSPAGEAPPPQTPHLLVQVQQLSKEKQSMEEELQRCQEVEQEASERVRRLERLVEVLRKKVGTGSLRAVV
ncbi:mirror-image polydactyly gene 1 protein isoform X2 [Acanthopagrus latus]|uniref:mirror-image polydactyly gene 1 protein isoform X2 n=1 Tax=Acanthopagrus latus TaxID=8177 RepID=UPI00187C4002|nr:mirror-image polydactyly gene 1 protein isoform X2 [Acanthopagrus latus]